MKAITILSFLFCITLRKQICGNKVSVLQYKNIDSCKNSVDSEVVEIPIVLENPLNEFTFCGNYKFKFLRRLSLLSMKEQKIGFSMTSFDQSFIMYSILQSSWSVLLTGRLE